MTTATAEDTATQTRAIPALAITEYNPTAIALSELERLYGKVIFPVTTKPGMADAKLARREMRTLRTSLEEKRKALKAAVLKRGRDIDSIAKDLTAQIQALETPIDDQIKKEEGRIAEEARLKAEAESRRIEHIKKRISYFTNLHIVVAGYTSAQIGLIITEAAGVIVDETFEEFRLEASGAKQKALAVLTNLFDSTKAIEVGREEPRIANEKKAEEARIAKAQEPTAAAPEQKKEPVIATTATVAAASTPVEKPVMAPAETISADKKAELEHQIELQKSARETADIALLDIIPICNDKTVNDELARKRICLIAEGTLYSGI